MAALIAGLGGAYYVGGGNTPLSQNLEIWTWYDLDAVRDNLAGNHTLMNDLDSTTPGYEELASPTANGGKGWQPIGFFEVTYASGCDAAGVCVSRYGLTGTFDGQGYEIHDLFINRPDEDEAYAGLFGLVMHEGIIKDISVVNSDITGDDGVGGLVGANFGTVSNSYSSGNITGDGAVGGLVGGNQGTVSNSHSTCNVIGNSAVGCLAGWNDSTVSNSYSSGNVTGDEHVGGLVGQNWHGTVSNSYSSGSVTGNVQVGGLVGTHWNPEEDGLIDSFWDIETSGQAISDGGTGKTTAQMKNIATFSGATWNITAVADPNTRNPAYIWNIVNGLTYPFLSWQS